MTIATNSHYIVDIFLLKHTLDILPIKPFEVIAEGPIAQEGGAWLCEKHMAVMSKIIRVLSQTSP